MARIKHTKNELKTQREALARYERYLPTLQLKKQQLQSEVRRVQAELEAKREEETQARRDLEPWIALFSEPIDLDRYLTLQEARIEQGNVAGVSIPVLGAVRLHREEPNPFETPPWVDDGLDAVEKLVKLQLERRVLEQQWERLREELRTTNQRVNLFEKVMIPEARENIRVIRIFLGDQQTAAVARGKIAKTKTAAVRA